MKIVELDGEESQEREIIPLKAKFAIVGAGARILFYPTLLYNVFRNKIQPEFRWWDKIDEFLLLGAVPFPKDVPHLRELGVQGVVTLNEPYETLVPTSLYEAYGIDHLVVPTRDYLLHLHPKTSVALLTSFIYDMTIEFHRGVYGDMSVDAFMKTCTLKFLTLLCIRCHVSSWMAGVPNSGISSSHPPFKDSSVPLVCYTANLALRGGESFGVKDKFKYLMNPDFLGGNASSGRYTYVHCKAGRGRSTTIVLCYLVKYRNMTPEGALDYVRSIRPRVLLAPSQWQAVQEYSKQKSESPDMKTQALVMYSMGDEVFITEADLEGYNSSEDIYKDPSICSQKFVKARPIIAKLSCLFSSLKVSNGGCTLVANYSPEIRIC